MIIVIIIKKKAKHIRKVKVELSKIIRLSHLFLVHNIIKLLQQNKIIVPKNIIKKMDKIILQIRILSLILIDFRIKLLGHSNYSIY